MTLRDHLEGLWAAFKDWFFGGSPVLTQYTADRDQIEED